MMHQATARTHGPGSTNQSARRPDDGKTRIQCLLYGVGVYLSRRNANGVQPSCRSTRSDFKFQLNLKKPQNHPEETIDGGGEYKAAMLGNIEWTGRESRQTSQKQLMENAISHSVNSTRDRPRTAIGSFPNVLCFLKPPGRPRCAFPCEAELKPWNQDSSTHGLYHQRITLHSKLTYNILL